MSIFAANETLTKANQLFGEMKINLQKEAGLADSTRDLITEEIDKMLGAVEDYRKQHKSAQLGLDVVESGLRGLKSVVVEHMTKHAGVMKDIAGKPEELPS